MSDKATDVIATALQTRYGTTENWARYILDALADAGIAVVELPEPTGRWAEGPEWLKGGRLGDRSGWVSNYVRIKNATAAEYRELARIATEAAATMERAE